MFAGYVGISIGAFYLYYLSEKRYHREQIENRSGMLAMYPFLLAERDRLDYLL